MTLLVLGLSHKTAPIAQREKAALSEAEARALLRDLTAAGAVAEAVALSTCNRTEIYASAPDPAVAEDVLCALLVAGTHISEDELACARYILRDDRAATQLFRVASSLDSMVVGESEIQGQVRQAWELAVEEGASGPVLNRLFRQALEVGKQVRAQTRIGTGSASVSAVAVELAEEVLDDLPGRQVLLIGAGRMAETTARALVDHGVREVVVANRTVGTARELAGRVGGRGVGFDRLAQELRGADIVISSTDAPHAILRRHELEPVMAGRGARPMVIVDISVPAGRRRRRRGGRGRGPLRHRRPRARRRDQPQRAQARGRAGRGLRDRRGPGLLGLAAGPERVAGHRLAPRPRRGDPPRGAGADGGAVGGRSPTPTASASRP